MLLGTFIDSLQTKGRYTFTRAEALVHLNCSQDAFRFAALRLIKKKRLIRPITGFYVIVPTEYQEVGSPPAAWFIDYLMKFCEQAYYVGLLSAAALHGAAHQQPQVFQVITTKTLREIKIANQQIQFFTKKCVIAADCQTVKTPTGYMQISTPEITAFDLLLYVKSAGHLSHIATVLAELQEQFDEKRLREILNGDSIKFSQIQRLGYLLEIVQARPEIIALLKQYIQTHKPRTIPLRPDKTRQNTEKNTDWCLYINEKIEADL